MWRVVAGHVLLWCQRWLWGWETPFLSYPNGMMGTISIRETERRDQGIVGELAAIVQCLPPERVDAVLAFARQVAESCDRFVTDSVSESTEAG